MMTLSANRRIGHYYPKLAMFQHSKGITLLNKCVEQRNTMRLGVRLG